RFAETACKREPDASMKIEIKVLNLLSDFSWWVRSAKISGAILCRSSPHRSGRVGKGAGTTFRYVETSRAPCPRVLAQLRIMTAWARRTRVIVLGKFRASAFAHPTRLRITLSQTESAPVCGSGPGGRPHLSLPSPSKTRGMARRQGALPGLLRAGVRIA